MYVTYEYALKLTINSSTFVGLVKVSCDLTHLFTLLRWEIWGLIKATSLGEIRVIQERLLVTKVNAIGWEDRLRLHVGIKTFSYNYDPTILDTI